MEGLDYFYADQIEQFTFYRLPKALFLEERFRVISSEAKLLYGLLLDRVSLSRANNWIDSLGRVYIIFPIEEIQNILQVGKKKAVQLMAELEQKMGLIEKKRVGLCKPNLIYVKNLGLGYMNPIPKAEKTEDSFYDFPKKEKCERKEEEKLTQNVSEVEPIFDSISDSCRELDNNISCDEYEIFPAAQIEENENDLIEKSKRGHSSVFPMSELEEERILANVGWENEVSMETSGGVEKKPLEVAKRKPINTDKRKLKKNNTENTSRKTSIMNCHHSSNIFATKNTELVDRKKEEYYLKYFHEKFSYRTMVIRCKFCQFERTEVDEIFYVLVNAISSTAKWMRIAGKNYLASVVQEQLKQIEEKHIWMVIDGLIRMRNATICHKRQYILTCLYNAMQTKENAYAV